jgi:hypothetical protein
MIALKVAHNGKPVCIAGIGDLGVISSHVTWVRTLEHQAEPHSEPFERVELYLHVGGLHTPTNEHRAWNTPAIEVGDTITVTIVETCDITPHAEVRTYDQVRDAQNEQDFVRKKASEYGWTIVEPPESPT